MPLLFTLGQRAALQATQRRLEAGERMPTFTTSPNQTTWERSTARCKKSSGPTRVFASTAARRTSGTNAVRSGSQQDACEAHQQVAEALDPTARVWRVQNCPMLSRASGERTQVEQQVLSSRIPSLLDVRMVCLTIGLRGSVSVRSCKSLHICVTTTPEPQLPCHLLPEDWAAQALSDQPSHMLGQLG